MQISKNEVENSHAERGKKKKYLGTEKLEESSSTDDRKITMLRQTEKEV